MKKVIVLAAFIAVMVTGCKKNETGYNPSYQHGRADDAGVAFAWYKLQFRILLERNSAFNANAYMGYFGIGLYEAVRYGTKNSVSLSTKLYKMPAMPAKENNDGYHWGVSANAVMASLTRSMYTGLTPANLASIDSLENTYNEMLKPAAGAAGFARSQAFGRSIATAIYNWYLTDDINVTNTGYVPPVFPGVMGTNTAGFC